MQSPLPFQLIDTALFDAMKNAGQLHWLQDMRMDIVFCYKLIKMYNQSTVFKPSRLEVLAKLNEVLDTAIRNLEANFKFLPHYLREKDKGQSIGNGQSEHTNTG